MAKAPVAIVVHSRPHETALVIAAVRQYRPEKLYVIADGPRQDHFEDSDLCREVRALFDDLGWDCQVHRMFRRTNVGIRKSFTEGLGWVFSQEASAIILEDDTVPDPSFFPFCEQLLGHYAEDEQVGMISGSRLVRDRAGRRPAFTFSRIPTAWGWATWARTWQGVDWEMSWRNENELSTLKHISLNRKHFYYLKEVLFLLDTNAVDTWDYQFLLSSLTRKLYSVIPSVNLVENIGFGDSASHTTRRPKGLHEKIGVEKADLDIPRRVPLNRGFERTFISRILPERRPERVWIRYFFARFVTVQIDNVYRGLVAKKSRKSEGMKNP